MTNKLQFIFIFISVITKNIFLVLSKIRRAKGYLRLKKIFITKFLATAWKPFMAPNVLI